jgi:hypothetical protein
MRSIRSHILVSVTALLLAGQCLGQSNASTCTVPSAWVAVDGTNIFTGERAKDIGDVAMERIRIEYPAVEDDAINRPLREMMQRLLAGAPGGPYDAQVSLFELPAVNAFTLPGARIFVSRKLVAFTESEDELAGVLAHELGHAITREPETDLSLVLRKVLGVTAVTSRDDVFLRYHELLENEARKPGILKANRKEKEQLIADRLAVLLMARAGYDPQAYAHVWDRLARLEGKTGGTLANFFGITAPAQKRLYQMIEVGKALPAQCRGSNRADAALFLRWKQDVVAYVPTRQQVLPGLIARKVLESPLRADIERLAFSRDGKYLLAQDAAGVFVLAREPLKVLFYVPQDDIADSHFTPDSRGVVLISEDLRVQRWNVESGKREWVRELAERDSCRRKVLSPDGKTVACYTWGLELQLLDVDSNKILYSQKEFYSRIGGTAWNVGQWVIDMRRMMEMLLAAVDMEFSPDGRYFLAGRGELTLGYDLVAQRPLSLASGVRAIMERNFAFLADGNLAGVAGSRGEKSGVVTFPAGELVSHQPLRGKLAGGARGPYLVIRPAEKYPVGILSVVQQKYLAASKTSAMDIYDDTFVAERKNGEVALYKVGTAQAFASIQLPQSELAGVRTAFVSPDFNWLALSQRGRGAVWDVEHNQRVLHVRGFEGAYIGPDGQMVAMVPMDPKPGEEKEDADVLLATVTLGNGETVSSHPLSKDERRHEHQHGRYLVYLHPTNTDRPNGDWVLEVRDAVSGGALWSRNFEHEMPIIDADVEDGTMTLLWGLGSKAAKELVKQDAALAARRSAMGEKRTDYYIEVLETATGRARGKVLLETGEASFRVLRAFSAGDWLGVRDNRGRVVLYALPSGEVKGRFFAKAASISPAVGMVALETDTGKLDIYDLSGMKKVQTLAFPVGLALGRFSSDGKRLFVLDRNQTAYLFDTAKLKVQ